MRIGILGSGLMGGKLGTLFARAGHDVVFRYSRSRKKLETLAMETGRGARAGTPLEAAERADVLLLAVHWNRVDDVLEQAAAGLLQPQPLLVLDRAHARDGPKVRVQRRGTHASELSEVLHLQRLREVLPDPGDRPRHAAEPAVADGHLCEPAVLLALQQPVMQLAQDERREHRDVGWRVEQPHQSKQRVEQRGLEGAHE